MTIEERRKKLSQEFDALIEEEQKLSARINEISTRLVQLQGAHNLLAEMEKEEKQAKQERKK